MNSDIIKIISFLIITGIIVFVQSLKSFKRKRLILDIATSKIKSAAIGGLVEIIGRALKINSEELKSPIQNIKSAAYVFIVYKKIVRNKKNEWKEIGRHYSDEHILLQDHSGGLATIKLSDCDLYYPKYKTYKNFNLSSKWLNKETRDILKNSFNLEVGEFSFFSFSDSYRIEEIAIPKGKILYALGHSFAPEECPVKLKTKISPSLFFKAHSENNRFFDNSNVLLSFISQEKTVSKMVLNSTIGLILGALSVTIGIYLLLVY